MADSSKANWASNALGHNGKKAQIKEFKRQVRWLEGGFLKQLEKEKRYATETAKRLKNVIRKLEKS